MEMWLTHTHTYAGNTCHFKKWFPGSGNGLTETHTHTCRKHLSFQKSGFLEVGRVWLKHTHTYTYRKHLSFQKVVSWKVYSTIGDTRAMFPQIVKWFSPLAKLVNLWDSLVQLSADLLPLFIRGLELRPQHLLVDGDLLDTLLHRLHSNAEWYWHGS